jgi:hypothetical protein
MFKENILAVDAKEKLVVIELKRDVAETFVDLQAIHYAAYCSTLTLEQVSEIMSEYNNESKEDNELKIRNFVPTDFTDFDNQPRTIIVANDFKEETLAAVLWLRDSGIDITCVNLEAYKLGKKIVITPNIIIPLPEAKEFMVYREQKTKVTSGTSTKLDEESFFKELREKRGDAELQLAQEIRENLQTEFPRINTNKNINYSILWFLLDYNSVYYWPFALRTDGKVEIIFQYLKAKTPFDDLSLREELLDRINKIPGVSIPENRINGRPTFPLIVLKDKRALETFYNTIKWIIKQIQKNSSN